MLCNTERRIRKNTKAIHKTYGIFSKPDKIRLVWSFMWTSWLRHIYRNATQILVFVIMLIRWPRIQCAQVEQTASESYPQTARLLVWRVNQEQYQFCKAVIFQLNISILKYSIDSFIGVKSVRVWLNSTLIVLYWYNGKWCKETSSRWIQGGVKPLLHWKQNKKTSWHNKLPYHICLLFYFAIKPGPCTSENVVSFWCDLLDGRYRKIQRSVVHRASVIFVMFQFSSVFLNNWRIKFLAGLASIVARHNF